MWHLESNMQTRTIDSLFDINEIMLLLITYFDLPTLLDIRIITRSFNDIALLSLFRRQSAEAYALQDALINHWVYFQISPNLTVEELNRYAIHSKNPSVDSHLYTLLLINKKLGKTIHFSEENLILLKKGMNVIEMNLDWDWRSDYTTLTKKIYNRFMPFLNSTQQTVLKLSISPSYKKYVMEHLDNYWDYIFSWHMSSFDFAYSSNPILYEKNCTNPRVNYLNITLETLNALVKTLEEPFQITRQKEVITSIICFHKFAQLDDAHKKILLTYLQRNLSCNIQDDKIRAQEFLIHLLSNKLITNSDVPFYTPKPLDKLTFAIDQFYEKKIFELLLPYYTDEDLISSFKNLADDTLIENCSIYLEVASPTSYKSIFDHLLGKISYKQINSYFRCITATLIEKGSHQEILQWIKLIYDQIEDSLSQMKSNNSPSSDETYSLLRNLNFLIPLINQKEWKKYHNNSHLDLLKKSFNLSTEKQWKKMYFRALQLKKSTEPVVILFFCYLIQTQPNEKYTDAILKLIKYRLNKRSTTGYFLLSMLCKTHHAIHPSLSQKLFEYILSHFKQNTHEKTNLLIKLMHNIDIRNAKLHPNLSLFLANPKSIRYCFGIKFINKLFAAELLTSEDLSSFTKLLLINFHVASGANKSKSFELINNLMKKEPVILELVLNYVRENHERAATKIKRYTSLWLTLIAETFLERDRNFFITHIIKAVTCADKMDFKWKTSSLEKAFNQLKLEECLLLTPQINRLCSSDPYIFKKLINLIISRFKHELPIPLIEALFYNMSKDKYLIILVKYLYTYKRNDIDLTTHELSRSPLNALLFNFISYLSEQTRINIQNYLAQKNTFFTSTLPKPAPDNQAETKINQFKNTYLSNK